MKDFDKIVQQLQDRKKTDQSRQKELEDIKYVVQALDAVQSSVIETTKATIDFLSSEIQNVRITNQKDSFKTPDAITGSNTVKQAIEQLKKVVEGKDIDFMPVLTRLEAVETAIGKLPTEYPSFPEIPKETAVNNLKEVTGCLDEVKEEIKKLKLDPKIDVKAPEVNVEAPKIEVNFDKVEELKDALQSIVIPDTSALIATLINKTVEVANEVRDLEFPVPNFRTQDIVNAITGKSSDVPRVEIDTSNSPIVYFGKADPSASTSEASWQISRGDTTNGLSKSFPNGDTSFSYVWDNRASLTYN